MENKKELIEITEATEEEMKYTRQSMKDKYKIIVPKRDLRKIIKLMKELFRWEQLTLKDSAPRTTDKMALEQKELFKKKYKKEITMAEGHEISQRLMVVVPFLEKQRIANEIRAILVKHKKVIYTKTLCDKVEELCLLHYGLKLTSEDVKWIVKIVSKTVWYEEDLDSSSEKCLDDLLIYADKRKRNKKVNHLELHDKVRTSLDWAVKKLKKNKKSFDPLYRDEIGLKVTLKNGEMYVGDSKQKKELKTKGESP